MDQPTEQKKSFNSNLFLWFGIVVVFVFIVASSLFLYWNTQRVEKKVDAFIEQTTKAAQPKSSGRYLPWETNTSSPDSTIQSTPKAFDPNQPPPPPVD